MDRGASWVTAQMVQELDATKGLNTCRGIGVEYYLLGFPDGSAGKESACNAGDLGLRPRLGT